MFFVRFLKPQRSLSLPSVSSFAFLVLSAGVLDRAATPPEAKALAHPRELLAKLVSGLDWRKSLSEGAVREGHVTC